MNGPEDNQDQSNADTPDTTTNPSDAYPPTRPGTIVILFALSLIVIGLGIENWQDVSSLAHLAGL